MSTSIEWTHELVEKLIDLYRQAPELWDPKNNNYHIKNKKHDAWTKISREMGCDMDIVKSKTTSLLSSFRREKSRMKKSTGTGKGREDIYISNWFAFKLFDFLSEKDTPKDNINTENVSDEEDSHGNRSQSALSYTNDQCELHNEEQSSPNHIQLDSMGERNNSIKRKTFVSPKKRNPQKKVKEDPRLTRAYEIIDGASCAPRHECFVYGELIGNKLRKFDERRRAILMHKINNLIFEAEMEIYNSQHEIAHQTNHINFENMYSSSSASSIICTPQSSPIPLQQPTIQLVSSQLTHEPSTSKYINL